MVCDGICNVSTATSSECETSYPLSCSVRNRRNKGDFSEHIALYVTRKDRVY